MCNEGGDLEGYTSAWVQNGCEYVVNLQGDDGCQLSDDVSLLGKQGATAEAESSYSAAAIGVGVSLLGGLGLIAARKRCEKMDAFNRA